MKVNYKYIASFSEEKPCIGGCGSKPAFDLLRGMEGIKVNRSYTSFLGHVGFDVKSTTKENMIKALDKLNEQYYWINKDSPFNLIEEHEARRRF